MIDTRRPEEELRDYYARAPRTHPNGKEWKEGKEGKKGEKTRWKLVDIDMEEGRY